MHIKSTYSLFFAVIGEEGVMDNIKRDKCVYIINKKTSRVVVVLQVMLKKKP